jgi:multidrug efflux pump subunit AcrB
MARAPETGFYFEPISERMALVVEGSPFPSDDHWAFIGDPVDMTPELARIEVATRWPGIDPEELKIEFDTNFERAVAEIERLQREEAEREPGSGEIDFDLSSLLSQADALKAAAAALQVPGAKETEETVEEAASETVGDAIARAHASEEEEPSTSEES